MHTLQISSQVTMRRTKSDSDLRQIFRINWRNRLLLLTHFAFYSSD